MEYHALAGLSTSWKSGSTTNGHDLLDRLGESGLTGLEIDYRVTHAALQQMWPRLRRGEFRALSVHNYCPTPPGFEGSPDVASLFNPASLDEEERKLAVEYGLKSIQLAAELEARVVVFHLGWVDVPLRMRELFDLSARGEDGKAALQARVEEVQRQRAEKIGAHIAPLLRTVEALNREAFRLGVLVGAENRYRPTQIPVGDEFELLFNEFAGGQLRYWHDVGHAEIFARLGLIDHEAGYLERYRSQLAGMHIHDIDGFRDHLAPGMGDFDFRRLLPYLQESSLRIIEAHDHADLQQLREGVVRLHAENII